MLFIYIYKILKIVNNFFVILDIIKYINAITFIYLKLKDSTQQSKDNTPKYFSLYLS